jgi:peroxiredoxin
MRFKCLAIVGALAGAAPLRADLITLKPATFRELPRIMPKVIVVRARLQPLVRQYPDALQKIPADLKSPVFCALTLGPREATREIVIAVDETLDQPPRILVDANGDGDLTNDPSLTPALSRFVSADGTLRQEYTVDPSIEIAHQNRKTMLSLNIRWLDRADPRRQGGVTPILYYPTYFTSGSMTLDGKTYRIALSDTLATGDFRGAQTGVNSGVALLVDVNGNEAFDGRGEGFDIRHPFNIRGTTYEIHNMDSTGLSFEVVKSEQRVAEITPPPDLRVGKPILPFVAKSLEGKTVRFPEQYRGKLVLLCFWGSWCGDCQAEVPYIAEAYAKFRAKGLEALGVSVDYPNFADGLKAFIKKNRIGFEHIYEGKVWQASLAVQYGITSIPTLYLVDGSTGKIVVTWGDELLGSRLSKTIAGALERRKVAVSK